MNTLTVDTPLQESLSSLGGLTEVRNSQGAVVGYFSPVTRESADVYAEAAAHFDAEEMKRRKLSNEPGRTTSDVLNRIAASEK